MITLDQALTRVSALLGDTGTIRGLDVSNKATSPITAMLNEVYQEWHQVADPFVDYASAWKTVSANAFSTTQTSSVIRSIESLSIGASYDAAPPLEEVTADEMMALQAENSTAGTPTRYHAETRNNLTWKLYVHPRPSLSTNVGIVYRVIPNTLSVDVHVIKLFDDEAYMLCRIAAAKLAHLLNRPPEFIADMWRGVPEQMQAVFRHNEVRN